MDSYEKLKLLGTAAQFDICAACGETAATSHSNDFPYSFIHKVSVPSMGRVSIFKVLLTNVCTNDCAYCVNQVGRDVRRTTYQPEELANLFMSLHRKRLVTGLFLSSGIGTNATLTMERMLDTVTILRRQHGFRGYVHLKLLPGASLDCIEEACRLSSRVSVNVEAPTPEHLARLSSRKDLDGAIIGRMEWVKRYSETTRRVPCGQTTQFVVGAAGESDRDILRTTRRLYGDIRLRRAYFSAYRPIAGSRLEGVPPAPPMREHRLYQSDWLLRVYRFPLEEVELALKKDGALPLSKDPKQAIAERQPWLFPVDVNRASYSELLRVPGIGPLTAKRIVQLRGGHQVRSLDEVRRLGGAAKRAAPYLWLKDADRASRPFAVQAPLFMLANDPTPTPMDAATPAEESLPVV